MFSCGSCTEDSPTGKGYLISKAQTQSFVSAYKDIHQADLQDGQTSIIKLEKSDYNNIINKYSKGDKFIDPDFFPNSKSLGTFPTITTDKWKRISEIIAHPNIFSKKVTPSDVKQAAPPSQAFFAVIATMSESEDSIRQIFNPQKYNENGIYAIKLRSNGNIKELLIDDFVPVNEQGHPIFSKPTNSNSIWVMLLEKARAKLYGSYAHMIYSDASLETIFQEITFAPTETYRGFKEEQDSEKHWRVLYENIRQKRPVCSLSVKQEKVNWKSINLSEDTYYSLLDAGVLEHKLGGVFKILKMRTFIENEIYKGEGSQNDVLFWEHTNPSEDKSRLLSISEENREGTFYILFDDFRKYFKEVYVNLAQINASYNSEELTLNQKNGALLEMEVTKEGFFNVLINQSKMNPTQGNDYVEDGFSRSTILIINRNANSPLEFVDGIFKYHHSNTLLRTHLNPGKYLLYCKLEKTVQEKNFPLQADLVVYSQEKVNLTKTFKTMYPDLLRKTFLEMARKQKRQLYNDDLMWSSWKLVTQGGYAYIAFGNAASSKSKFIIKFNENTFQKYNFQLKKPFKGKGEQTLEVLPGEQEIILLRIKNSKVREINFPPPIDLQVTAVL